MFEYSRAKLKVRPQNVGPKTAYFSGDFRTTSWLKREYLRNETNYW